MDVARLVPAQAITIFYREVALTGAGLVLAALSGLLMRRRPALPAPSAGPASRRLVLYGLAGLWVLDGLLQLQPAMTTSFLSSVVAPTMQGQPAPVAALIAAGVRLWAAHPIGFNVVAVYAQVGIGLALLLGREDGLRRTALWASLGWAGLVWVFGEGLGGILSGGSWLAGTPGSAFLYGAGTVLLLLPVDRWAAVAGRRALAPGLAVFWLGGAVAQAWPPAGYWAPHALQDAVSAMAQLPQPAALSASLAAFAAALAHDPALWNAAIVASLLGLAAAWWRRPDHVATWIGSGLWAFLAWWLVQDFGVLGGTGTDPNAGPLEILLIVAYAVAARERGAPRPAPLTARSRLRLTGAVEGRGA
jgi:hypothetical protein